MTDTSASVYLLQATVSAANERDIKLNMRREIPYLQATEYYFQLFII